MYAHIPKLKCQLNKRILLSPEKKTRPSNMSTSRLPTMPCTCCLYQSEEGPTHPLTPSTPLRGAFSPSPPLRLSPSHLYRKHHCPPCASSTTMRMPSLLSTCGRQRSAGAWGERRRQGVGERGAGERRGGERRHGEGGGVRSAKGEEPQRLTAHCPLAMPWANTRAE